MTVDREAACSSCGLAGSGKYCSACGSLLYTQLPTVRELGAEVTTEVLGFHKRSFATLWALLVRPGIVTQAYRDGQGSRFISPVKVYVAISAMYFTLAAVTGQSLFTGSVVENLRPDVHMALSLPVFALLLKFFYGWIGGGNVRVTECVSFALTFQSALFTLWLPMLWLPRVSPVFMLYAPWYIWRGAERLWDERGILSPVRAVLMTLFYFLGVLLTAVLLGKVLPAWP